MKKSYKDRILSLGLSYQKEVTFLLLINVLVAGIGVGAYFYFHHWLCFAVMGVALLAVNFLYLSKYGSLEKINDITQSDADSQGRGSPDWRWCACERADYACGRSA